jgi:hypothetical protein
MFSSRIVARALCACLGFLFVAGAARAQFNECPLPSDLPEVVYATMTEQADLNFGGLTQQVCDSIVKKGVATCKVQVKAAAKCGHKAADGLYQIMLKQCAQIADAVDRAACKQGAKTFRDFNQNGYDGSRDDGLAVCEGMFAEALNNACMDIVIK